MLIAGIGESRMQNVRIGLIFVLFALSAYMSYCSAQARRNRQTHLERWQVTGALSDFTEIGQRYRRRLAQAAKVFVGLLILEFILLITR